MFWLIFIAAVIYFGVKIANKHKNNTSYSDYTASQKQTQKSAPVQNYRQPTIGVNRVPADALINSRYYTQYKSTFDLIWYNGKQPKYKIDWLLESLELGHKLERSGYYVTESMKAGLPYFCETEREFDYFEKWEKPILKGFVDGILDIAFYYKLGDAAHPSKLKYWKNQLIQMAFDGNLQAQAGLLSATAQYIFSGDDRAVFKEKYESKLWETATKGNHAAQLAVGIFMTHSTCSDERIDLLTKATEGNTSDAWYWLAKEYESRLYVDPKTGEMRHHTVSQEEKDELTKKKYQCLLAGAEANTGMMAGVCQYKVAVLLEDENPQMAKYWYERAKANGENVDHEIEWINKELGV